MRRVEVPIANLPASLHGFTIVQITDIHVGPTIKRNYLDAIVDAVVGASRSTCSHSPTESLVGPDVHAVDGSPSKAR